MEELTEEYILSTGYFGKTEREGVPSLFNGDNIMLAIRTDKIKGEVFTHFDAYLHNEYNGSVHWAVNLRTRDEFRNFYLGIEKVDIYV